MLIRSRVVPLVFTITVLLPHMFRHDYADALGWKDVKPMYLVSMYPAPSSMESQEKTTTTKKDTTDRKDPMVLNLETAPMTNEMVPGGQQAMDRIFGGNVAEQCLFPYQVGFLLQRPKGLYWCGGSLISDEFVLTAAHCVDMAKRALIFLGAYEIKNANEVGQIRLMVNRSNFIIFPTWNPRRLKDDIALVRLPKPIEFTDRIHPIQLPKRSYEYRNFKDKMAVASGWGRYATGVHAISNELRFVKLQIVDGLTCKQNFPLSYRSTNICTSGRFAKSTCSGDSGGPLVLQRKHSKRRVLIGITSFGSIFGCDRGYPAAFTKVASYLDWISDETGIESNHERTHAMLFEAQATDYSIKGRRRLRNIDESVADLAHMTTIHERMQKFPDAQLLREETNKFTQSLGYNLFIL